MTNQPANAKEALLSGFTQVDYQTWRSQVERALKGGDFDRRLVSHTLEGIAVQPLYTPDNWPAAQDSHRPGAAPYRRGPLAIGRHGERWNMRPRYDQPDPERLQREIADDLARGARSLWLSFDREARLGRVPVEPPRAATQRGVGCISAEQLGTVLRDVPLEQVTVALDAGANALPVAAYFAALVKERGLTLERCTAWLHADPLGALARDGELPGSLASARSQLTALARFVAAHTPRVRSVIVSTAPYHDAGAHAAQELGFALATALTYLRWLTAEGLQLSAACAQIGFSLPVGTDFFMEIAKLRALRQCWAQVVAACGGDAAAQRCEVHASSSERTKTARDPWVNLLRETTETFAAAVGGADAITSGGFDRTLGPSDAFARRIAGNVQVILDEEAHVTQVADPAGGAYYIESLTDQLAERAWQQLQAIEAASGMEAALLSGKITSEIEVVAAARDRLIDTRKQAVTGVSEFAHLDEERPLRAEPDWNAVAAARRDALASARRSAPALQRFAGLADSDPLRTERAIEAAAQGATLDELSAALWSGEPVRIAALSPRRHARAYERLRDASDAAARTRGKRPSIFLCNLGPIPEHKARAQFAAGLFQAGGLLVHDNDGFSTAEAAANAFAASGAELCALCGSDEAYPRFALALSPLLRERGAKGIVLAGRFGNTEAAYRAAGVTESIYMGCNAIEILTRLLAAAGVQS